MSLMMDSRWRLAPSILARRCSCSALAPAASHQVRQTDDGVERGADLMAHVGQEGALGLAGGRRRVARCLQLRRSALALGDIARGGQHTGDGTIGVAVDAGVGQHLPDAAIGMAHGQRPVIHRPLQECLAHAFARAVGLGEHLSEVAAHQLGPAAPRGAFGGPGWRR
jgi:hypothetical protein